MTDTLDNPFDRAAQSQADALAHLEAQAAQAQAQAEAPALVSAQLPPVPGSAAPASETPVIAAPVDPQQAVQQIQQLAASLSATPDHTEEHHFEGDHI